HEFAMKAVALVALGTVCGICHAWYAARLGLADDGWRRTAQGWQYVGTWESNASWRESTPLSAVSKAPAPAARHHTRWDTHPAVLALAQVVIAIAALATFAVQRQQRVSWPALIARSFRASAFG